MRLLFGRGGPEREPGDRGEWVDLSAYVQGPARLERAPDPLADLVADLVRRYDPGGYLLACPVAGCRWVLDVPRMELDPLEPLDGLNYVASVHGATREDVELALREHVEWHAALTETAPGPGNGSWDTGQLDWPQQPPPRWDQQEWCDGGTCEHPACLAELGP